MMNIGMAYCILRVLERRWISAILMNQKAVGMKSCEDVAKSLDDGRMEWLSQGA
jgi:hypothetical protein